MQQYGSLGYIDNGRRAPKREHHSSGTNGNPSRKELTGALRPIDMYSNAVPQTGTLGSHQALLERRCVFLEDQDKRKSAEIADLRARLTESAPLTESVTGTVLRDTFQVQDTNDAPSPAAAKEGVSKGTKLLLFYPMKRLRADDGEAQVWMRHREVCPVLATVSYKWVLIFGEREVDGAAVDSVFVGNFGM